ncbi:MAG: DNA methyltransferase [Lysobacter sp.]|nr:MAG: DNA methyltransferase [Lysobacter sp.]
MSAPSPLETFLASVAAIHSSGGGTKETSYYTPLNLLFDEIGRTLKPKVRCVMQLKNLGAGNPDGGFFTADQFDRKTDAPKDAGKPGRGVVEVKSPSDAVDDIASSKQIDKYWARYQLVLVTNLRDWLLLGERDGQRVTLERYTLAADEALFWDAARHAQTASKTHGEAFCDFLTRVLRHNAPLSDPKDLAWLLASYAREARHRVEHAPPQAIKQLDALKSSLEDALGVHFEKDKGAHFFRSTLVQTLFYGLFSAWVLRHEDGKTGPFDWRTAAHDLHVPMVSALFGQLSQPNKLKALNLTEVLDWAGDALNRVAKHDFFAKFESARSVQYFYEPFLEAFDPALRKELGVWYTPEEIVRYQVARVDEVLRSELGLADGLADSNVVVLDPCCGTGAYLVETLRVIGERLKSQGMDALAAHKLKKAAIERLFGFELLPAPYVVAHLQIGLLLRHLGVPLQDDDERAGIYLTNALTGWEPPKDPKQALPFPEFSEERDAADHVKQTQKILVVIGNPPYNAFSGVAQGEEQDLIAPYKEGLIDTWGIKKFNLDELYVRFFRLAERRIAEQGGRGVVSYITNFSYLRDPSFVVMRQHLLGSFDQLWLDNLNGDSRETGKLTPDGDPDPSVFSTDYNREGIRKGTAVAVLVRRGGQPQVIDVRYREWWGATKREALVASLDDSNRDKHYSIAKPSKINRFGYKPGDISDDYYDWPKLSYIGEVFLQGLDEDRALDLIDFDLAELSQRIRLFCDAATESSLIQEKCPGLSRKSAMYDPEKSRQVMIKEGFKENNLLKIPFRPFDIRWAYHTLKAPIWKRPRPQLKASFDRGDSFLISRPSGVADREGMPLYWSSSLFARDAMRGHGVAFATHTSGPKSESGAQSLLFESTSTQANLSPTGRAYLASLGLPDPNTDRAAAEALWLHALAIGYSPEYLTEHADGIRGDWPRIPLPASRDALLASVELGRQVAALLETEHAVPGVTAGNIRPELKLIAVVTRQGGGPLQPEEFRSTAGWGHTGKGGVTMPGRGKLVTRTADDGELASTLADAGMQTHDVYLNDTAYWRNVPPPVWEFTIGGYQVLKKWLSYREYGLLGRAMTAEELQEVTGIARRLAALVLLQPALDANYRAVVGETYPWPADGALSET